MPNNADLVYMTGFLLPFLLILVLIISAKWKLYEKANQLGWAAIVPLYSSVVMLKIAENRIGGFYLYLFNIYPILICYFHFHQKFL